MLEARRQADAACRRPSAGLAHLPPRIEQPAARRAAAHQPDAGVEAVVVVMRRALVSALVPALVPALVALVPALVPVLVPALMHQH